jgi:hypothetical protein
MNSTLVTGIMNSIRNSPLNLLRQNLLQLLRDYASLSSTLRMRNMLAGIAFRWVNLLFISTDPSKDADGPGIVYAIWQRLLKSLWCFVLNRRWNF